MKRLIQKSTLVTTLCLLASSTFAEDWTGWRGNHRDGKSAETGLANKWPESGPKLLWQTKDLGAGYSTPSSAGGLVYLISNQGAETEELICLKLTDGSVQWRTKLGAVGKNTGPQYPGSRSTPSIVDGEVFALGSAGDLVCADAKSGKVKWSKNLQSEFDGLPGKWAYTESPLVDGDVIICSPGGKSATVVALKKSDGSVVWKSAIADGDEASYSSPVAAEIDGVKQYVMFLAKGAAGLNAKTGELIWRYTKTADKDANVQIPIVNGKLVYTAAGRVGGGLAEVAGTSSEPKQVYFDKAMPNGMGGAVLVDGYLYGASGATLMCIEYATGKKMWQDRSIGASSVAYADGKLYLHGENNDIALVAATPEAYKELARFTPPNASDRGNGKAWTHPVLVDGKLIIRDVDSVWCFDVKN